MWIENGLLRRPPPKPDRRFSRIRLSGSWLPMDWLRHSPPGLGGVGTSRVGLRPAHLSYRRSTVDKSRTFKPGIPAHPSEQPCGTTRTLVGCWLQICPHHVPTPLCSTVVTRFFALTRALTPTDPLTIGRGSLIHVTRTSNHSISNHLRISAGRVHCLCANSTILFGLRHCSVGSSDSADRIEFTFSSIQGGRRYGLVVHFQLLPTRGYRLGAVTFSYWLYSVSQVRDSHPAVQVRSQAHGAGTASSPVPTDRPANHGDEAVPAPFLNRPGHPASSENRG